MSNSTSNDWLSYNLYYYPFDTLLTGIVSRFIKSKNIDHFFFVKYFEKGPHIRLRIKSCNENEKEIYDSVVSLFEKFIEKNPSDKDLYEKHFKEKFNSFWKYDFIEKSTYDQEVERYGGYLETMAICENQFEISSRDVLSYLENNDVNYSNKLGYALKLNIGLIKAFCLSLHQTVIFYEVFTKEWILHSLNAKESEYQRLLDRKLSQMQTKYDRSEEYIDDLLTRLWEDLEEDSWIESNNNIYNQLEECIEINQLKIPDTNSKKYFDNKDDDKLYFMYKNILHMTHNRIGLFSPDEAYITFLLWQYFRKMVLIINS